LARLTTDDLQELGMLFERQLEIVRILRDAGVRFLVGSDTGGPYVFPGSSVHEELELLVRAGLTPLEAIQAATLNPARFLELEDSLGSLDEGKFADMVLLAANPLEDIANIRRIEGVVLSGRYLSRQALDEILNSVRAAARSAQEK
jgi:imidazolonepropionase-like amidohydrolase